MRNLWLLLTIYPTLLRGQLADTTWHPCMDAIRCLIHNDTTAAQKRETATSLYVLGSFAVVGSNAIWQWDTDDGNYPNTFYPEKFLAHAGSAFVLTEVAIGIGVKPITAVAITSGAGIAFEITQGHVNGYDVAADITGAFAGMFVAKWLNKVRF